VPALLQAVSDQFMPVLAGAHFDKHAVLVLVEQRYSPDAVEQHMARQLTRRIPAAVRQQQQVAATAQ
jgi:hypothetical protein